MTTLKDIARLAGVSVSTASYALNNRPEVKDETRKKILEIASKLNYKPSGIAKDLKLKKTGTIGLVLSSFSGPFYSGIINGIEEITFSNGYNLIICSSYGGKNSTAAKFLSEKRTDGILLLASDITDEIILRSANENFPIVLMDRELEGKYIKSVTVNNRKAAYEAVSHLVNTGYRKIGYFSGPVISIDNLQRFEGYRNALRDNDIGFCPKWNLQGQFTRNGGHNCMLLLAANNDLPEAVFCGNDEMAIGAIEAARELGINIPEDLAIMGFDDIEPAQYIKPTLSTVRHPKYLLGSAAAHLLIQALDKNFDTGSIKLDTQLIIRESCGAKRKKTAGL